MGVQELASLDDVWSINERKRVYSKETVIEKLSLPALAKAFCVEGVRQAPSGGRLAPGDFTFKQEYTDGAENDWTCARKQAAKSSSKCRAEKRLTKEIVFSFAFIPRRLKTIA